MGKLTEILRDARPDRQVGVHQRVRGELLIDSHSGTRQANMQAHMWDQMQDWLLKGAIETDERWRGIRRTRRRGQLALIFAQKVALTEVEENGRNQV